MNQEAVPTVTGTVPVAALGFTLMHEHIVLLDAEIEVNGISRWRDEVEIPAARAELAATRSAGVDTLVDLTVIGMGRNVQRVRSIVEPTGLNVIVATGIYTFDEMPPFFRARGRGSTNGGPDPVEAMMVREIEEGIGRTGIRAGIIKVATDVQGIMPDIEMILRAAARAHRRTGAPITTHTDAGSHRGRDQQALFRSEGVDLSRIVIGHCGDSTDFAYLTELMDAGSYLGMDRFGYDLRLPATARLDTVVELVRRGYAERLLLSHDATCYSDNLEPETRRRLWPNCSHRYVSEQIVPALLERGVAEADIEQMMVGNPRVIFGRRDSY